MAVIYSTASADQIYPRWKDHPRVGKYDSAVIIKGGAGVQSKTNFITPRGVATLVEAEDLDFLKTVPAFMEGVKRGFFSVDEKAKRASNEIAEDVAAGMTAKDGGAQKTKEDFKASGAKVKD